MIELSVVLVIIGLLVAGGVVGFSAVLEGRRVAKTASALYQAKQCLLKRVFYSNTYPSYTGNATVNDQTDDTNCSVSTQYDLSLDVDGCLCNIQDAWGQPFMYLEGVWIDDSGNAQPLTGAYVIDNQAQSQNATYPDATSEIVDKDGTTIPGIAFVLISYGRDGTADNTTYRSLFNAAFGGSGTQVALIDPTAATPDFSADDVGATTAEQNDDVRDDQIVYVTGAELISTLTQ